MRARCSCSSAHTGRTAKKISGKYSVTVRLARAVGARAEDVDALGSGPWDAGDARDGPLDEGDGPGDAMERLEPVP